MISNGLSTSKIGQASLALLPRIDINFANPMATTACLFAILIIVVGGYQIFSTPVEGFQAQLDPPSSAPHQILVKITSLDQMTIDGRSTSLVRVYSDIARAIGAHKRLGESTHINLIADKDSKWVYALTVRDAAREAGDDDFGFGWRR